MSIINAHRLYEIKKMEKISSREFRTKLMHELAGDSDSSSVHNSRPSSSSYGGSNEDHQLVLTDTQRDCRVCSDRKIGRVTTRYKCDSCNVSVCAHICYDMHRHARDL
jgi:hypothetical protein